MGEQGCRFEVYRNYELTVEELKNKNPRVMLISPGPGTPQDSGIFFQTVLKLGPRVSLFGVCMNLQCIGEAFGGKIVRPFFVSRYHSLVIEKDSFPSGELEVTAWTADGLVMASCHMKYRHIQGVQFHPESIITTEGKTIVCNFIKLMPSDKNGRGLSGFDGDGESHSFNVRLIKELEMDLRESRAK
ncbi:unnamed protein product [Arabidopsis lyrata]|nr:unnamed protein product [Arabidopsis lyrata]